MSPDAYLEMADVESRHWWFVGRRVILETILSGLALPQDAQVLEVGSGTGGNLQMLSNFGNVSAIEMDAHAIEIARVKTQGKIDIRAGSCPAQVPFTDRKFDLICIFDVLEHIEDDLGTLQVLRGLLSEHGRLVITVPAYRWLWSAHDEYLHHKRRYAPGELRARAVSAGLLPVQSSYFNTLLLPLVVIARLKDRLLGSATASGATVPPLFVNAILTHVLSAERLLVRHLGLPLGVSQLMVLHRD